jgi:hypothetical protein
MARCAWVTVSDGRRHPLESGSANKHVVPYVFLWCMCMWMCVLRVPVWCTCVRSERTLVCAVHLVVLAI